jgi:hypothetical protein
MIAYQGDQFSTISEGLLDSCCGRTVGRLESVRATSGGLCSETTAGVRSRGSIRIFVWEMPNAIARGFLRLLVFLNFVFGFGDLFFFCDKSALLHTLCFPNRMAGAT